MSPPPGMKRCRCGSLLRKWRLLASSPRTRVSRSRCFSPEMMTRPECRSICAVAPCGSHYGARRRTQARMRIATRGSATSSPVRSSRTVSIDRISLTEALNKRVKRTWKHWSNFIEDRWIGPAGVLVLGDLLPDIDLPLGRTGGIAGVRHVFLDDLRSASQLKGMPTAEI